MKWSMTLMITAMTLGGCQGPSPATGSDGSQTQGQFARFRDLHGDWRATESNPTQAVTHTYRTIANGSVVVETAFAGTPHEMITVIHPDGPDLVLTHYCAAGNQPQMVAMPTAGNEIPFSFVRAGNLTDPGADHMRDVTFTFVDDDRISTRWSFWSGGEKTNEMVIELVRVR